VRNGSRIGVACWLLNGQIGSSLYGKYSKYASWRSSECGSQLGAIVANCGLGEASDSTSILASEGDSDGGKRRGTKRSQLENDTERRDDAYVWGKDDGKKTGMGKGRKTSKVDLKRFVRHRSVEIEGCQAVPFGAQARTSERLSTSSCQPQLGAQCSAPAHSIYNGQLSYHYTRQATVTTILPISSLFPSCASSISTSLQPHNESPTPSLSHNDMVRQKDHMP